MSATLSNAGVTGVGPVASSITAMEEGLRNAFAERNWERASRCIERLKMIILEATVKDNPEAIAMAGKVLMDAAERLELLHDLPSAQNEATLAARLHADAETAAYALRIRPRWRRQGMEKTLQS